MPNRIPFPRRVLMGVGVCLISTAGALAFLAPDSVLAGRAASMYETPTTTTTAAVPVDAAPVTPPTTIIEPLVIESPTTTVAPAPAAAAIRRPRLHPDRAG